MKFFFITIFFLNILLADNFDWDDTSSWSTESEPMLDNEVNTLFEKAKIQNRANEEYTDRIYEYITGDYRVENNTIELANIQLNNNLQDRDIEINMYVDNLDVEGNRYSDPIPLRENRYKNFVYHDENRPSLEQDREEENSDYTSEALDYEDNSQSQIDNNPNISSSVRYEDPQYSRVENKDISEIGALDFRNLNAIKEVNVFIEDVNVLVK